MSYKDCIKFCENLSPGSEVEMGGTHTHAHAHKGHHDLLSLLFTIIYTSGILFIPESFFKSLDCLK
jgi:hypothetical protein